MKISSLPATTYMKECKSVNTAQPVVLKSIVEKVIFSKDDFVILKLKGGKIALGNHLLPNAALFVNEAVEITGTWEQNPKNKEWQFRFVFINIVGSDDIYYFLTKVVKGVGEKLAKHLIESLGAERTADMIENSPGQLACIKGIGKKTAQKIHSSWLKHVSERQISELLLPLGFTISQVLKIFSFFKEDVENIKQRIEQNIYILSKVPGIGFLTVDAIALRNGMVEHDSLKRISSAAIYTLNEIASTQGHSAVSSDVLFANLDALLVRNAPKSTNSGCFDYDKAINFLKMKHEIVEVSDGVYATSYYFKAESFVYDFVQQRTQQSMFPVLPEIKLERFLADTQNKLNKRFDESQLAAIRGINKNSIMSLVGYAGTGKTTICYSILELLAQYYNRDQIHVTALSGIATDRIKTKSGFDGSTIQSLLVKYHSSTLPFKVLVIDEASMVDSVTLYKLLSLVEDNTRVVFVGDTGQLPPLSGGAPFVDIVELELVPVFRLENIYRQSNNSVISHHANDIRKGMVPDISARYNDFCFGRFDFEMDRETNNQRIAEHIVKAFESKTNILKEAYESGDYRSFLYSHQVISPMKKGVLGVENLNSLIQSVLNPDSKGFEVVKFGRGVHFREMDKVLHMVNENMAVMTLKQFEDDPYLDEDKLSVSRIFNGFFGAVLKVDSEKRLIWVFYASDNTVVRYTDSDISRLLSLAYCCTIHKSQGSGFGNLIIPMTMTHANMLNSRLLYTAITRAKNMCYMVGESRAFMLGCKKHHSMVRSTVIRALLSNYS